MTYRHDNPLQEWGAMVLLKGDGEWRAVRSQTPGCLPWSADEGGECFGDDEIARIGWRPVRLGIAPEARALLGVLAKNIGYSAGLSVCAERFDGGESGVRCRLPGGDDWRAWVRWERAGCPIEAQQELDTTADLRARLSVIVRESKARFPDGSWERLGWDDMGPEDAYGGTPDGELLAHVGRGLVEYEDLCRVTQEAFVDAFGEATAEEWLDCGLHEAIQGAVAHAAVAPAFGPRGPAPSSPMVSVASIRAALAGGVACDDWPDVAREVAVVAEEREDAQESVRMLVGVLTAVSAALRAAGLCVADGAHGWQESIPDAVRVLARERDATRGPAKQWSLLVGVMSAQYTLSDEAGPLVRALAAMDAAASADNVYEMRVAQGAATGAAVDEYRAASAPQPASGPSDAPNPGAESGEGVGGRVAQAGGGR